MGGTGVGLREEWKYDKEEQQMEANIKSLIKCFQITGLQAASITFFSHPIFPDPSISSLLSHLLPLLSYTFS